MPITEPGPRAREEALRVAALDVMLDPLSLMEPVRDAGGWIVDFRYVEVNRAAARYLGRTRDEVVGTRFSESLAEETAPAIIAAYAELLAGGEPLVIDGIPLRSRIAGGVTRRFDIRAVAVEGCVEVVWRDVTHRVETAERLAESEAEYRLLADHAGDLVTRLDVTNTLEYVSPSALPMLGRASDELVGTSLWDLVHREDVDGLRRTRGEGLAAVDGRVRARTRLRRADGSYLATSVVGQVLRDASGLPAGAVLTWRDIQAVVEAEQALEASRDQYRLLAEHSGDLVTSIDLPGTLTYVSPSVRRLLGYGDGELVGTTVWDVLHPDDLAAVRAARARGLEPGGDGTRVTARVRRADGSYLPMTMVGQVVRDAAGAPVSAVLTWRDVQGEVEARAALEESEARYRLLADNASDVVMLADDRMGVRWVSPSTRTVLGRPEEDLLGAGALAIIHPDDAAMLRGVVGDANEARADTRVRFRWQCGNGDYRWMEAIGRYFADGDSGRGGRVVHVRDIDAQVRAEEAMATQARTDALTGLLNRAEALNRLQATLAHLPRAGRVGVLFCDLDDLKGINDRLGHAAGDLLLITTAGRLAAGVREQDLVARIGGDEFLVVLPGVGGVDDLLVVAERFRRSAASPLPVRADHPAVVSTISIGIALARPGDSVDDVIARADAAMYAAKQAGGNAVVASPNSTR